LYCDVSTSLDGSIHSFIELARHIRSVLGDNQWKRPIWQVRVLQPDNRVVELTKFEDYILKPVREGFGMDSLFALDAAMKTAGRDGKLALNAMRKEIPDWNDRIAADEKALRDKDIQPIPKNGELGKGRPKDDSFDNVKAKGGNDVDYLTARLKRDHPDIAKRLAKNEIKSVRAAAIEAGIVKLKSQLDIAKSAWKRMNDSERTEFLSWINDGT